MQNLLLFLGLILSPVLSSIAEDSPELDEAGSVDSSELDETSTVAQLLTGLSRVGRNTEINIVLDFNSSAQRMLPAKVRWFHNEKNERDLIAIAVLWITCDLIIRKLTKLKRAKV